MQAACLGAVTEGSVALSTTSSVQEQNVCVQDKEYIFPQDYPDWESVYIFRRYGKNYYFREKDPKTNEWLNAESLHVGTNRDKARQKAIQWYLERKSKRQRNVLHKSINSTELNRLYLLHKKDFINKRKRLGLSVESYDTLIHKLSYWLKYVKEKGHERRAIEDIPKEIGEKFGFWIEALPKQNHKDSDRSVGVINRNISATKSMYKWACKKGYIGESDIPAFENLDKTLAKSENEERDTLWEDEWKKLENHIAMMSKNKKVSALNRAKYTQDYWYFKLAYETGMRLIEVNNLTWDKVQAPRHETGSSREINRSIYIEKTKNGRKRTITSPVAYIFNGLEKLYKERGVTIDRTSNSRVFFKIQTHKCIQDQWNTDKAMVDRLDDHMERIGLLQKLSSEVPARRITPNSARHYFCTYKKVNDNWSWERIALHVGHDASLTEHRYSKATSAMINAKAEKTTGFESIDSYVFKKDGVDPYPEDVQIKLREAVTRMGLNHPDMVQVEIENGNLNFVLNLDEEALRKANAPINDE